MPGPTQTNVIGEYDAKVHFFELLERVERGEELTITRHGTAVAKLGGEVSRSCSTGPMPGCSSQWYS